MTGIPLVNLARQYERLAPNSIARSTIRAHERTSFWDRRSRRSKRPSRHISACAIASAWRAEPTPCT